MIILLLSSCSLIDESHYYVDPRLTKHVDLFFSEAENNKLFFERNGLHVVVQDIYNAGIYKKGYKVSTIVIDSDIISSNDFIIEYVVLHELGHWIGRSHNDEFSIMNPNKYSGEYVRDSVQRQMLIQELFR